MWSIFRSHHQFLYIEYHPNEGYFFISSLYIEIHVFLFYFILSIQSLYIVIILYAYVAIVLL